MALIKNVAVLGASGALGQVIIPALLRAGFSVTPITRSSNSDNISLYPEIGTRSVRYDDVDALTSAMHGQDAIIEAFNPAAAVNQIVIVRASLTAGVQHLITPDFSSDTFNPHVNELLTFDPKRTAQRELERLVAEAGGKLCWTAIIVGAWYDWAIEKGVFWVNSKNETVTRLGSGEQKYTISRIGLVGDAVVHVLQHPNISKIGRHTLQVIQSTRIS